jgi:hypothetical protein
MNTGGSVTLIFHRVQTFKEEHIVNSLAAMATRSQFAHVEIAIGSDSNETNQITNVCRIFNDHIGVALTQRTGRNPSFVYLQLGCSKAQEQKMLLFAKEQVGRPFSSSAMIRSITSCPRRTNGNSYFCAELVSAVLKEGNLLSTDSNPGSATPESLYRLYSKHAAMTGNPFTLRCLAHQTRQTQQDLESALHMLRRDPLRIAFTQNPRQTRFQALKLNTL